MAFCATCRAVQPLAAIDHFARLGLRPGFDLDDAVIERAYVDRQQDLHPDRFVTRRAQERRYSAEQSMALNEAFEVLRDPLSRAEYLLELAGHGVDRHGETIDDPELLAEALESREALADAGSPADVATLMAATARLADACRADLSARIAAPDWTGAARATRRLRYLAKLDDEARRRSLAFGAIRT